ncbi:anti-sigma-I factor RsgI family protein [Peribacillus sp. NPDC046944]|uniref:anti-sigma factor domain-containing protein n=1 Tax=unclassified Peribacillus TaxID=2675266 RepID=UPI003D061F7C
MKKGVVLSINKRFVTLLTPEGEFLKTKRKARPYKVGEEITFSTVKPSFNFSFSTFHFSAKKTVVLSLTSSFLILISLLPSLFSDHVSAYMTIDVNPSIELELNDELEVLKLTGLNGDGKLVIREISNWKGKNVKTVTNRIVKTTKQLGYLKGKKQIVVSTTLLDENKELDKNLKSEINKISTQDNIAQTKLKVIPATESDRKHAREQGISTGKYVEKKLEKKEKEKGDTRKPVQGSNANHSRHSENNSSKRELHKKEAGTIPEKNKELEQKEKAVKSLRDSVEESTRKKEESPQKKQKVNNPKVKAPKQEPSKPKPQKEKAAKPQPQKEKAAKPKPQKEKVAKPQPQKVKAQKPKPQKEKVAKPKPQKVKAQKPKPQKEKAAKPQPQKVKAPKPQPQKEKAAKPKPQKVKAPKPQPQKEKAQKPQPQKEKASRQQLPKEKAPKQPPHKEKATKQNSEHSPKKNEIDFHHK